MVYRRVLCRSLTGPAAGQLVEVVAGDVRVEQELLGDIGGRHATARLALGIGLAAGVHEQVDLAPSWVAERRGDRRYGGGELRRCERGLRLRRHRSVFYLWA